MDAKHVCTEVALLPVQQRWLHLALGSRSRAPGERGSTGPCEPATLFANFSEAVLAELLAGLKPRRLSPGSTIFERGSRADHVYLVLAGSVECHLLREDLALGLESATRPKPPVNEVVSLESLPRGGRCPPSTVYDFVLEDAPAPLRSSRVVQPKFLKSYTAAALPAPALPEEQEERSQPQKEKPPEVRPICTVTPQEALRRDDRLLRPVAEVVRALAASLPARPEPAEENFQQRWQQFQAHLGGLVESRTKKGGAPPLVDTTPAAQVLPEPVPMEALEVVAPNELEPLPEPEQAPLSRLTRLVAIDKEFAGAGDILGAVACLARRPHVWTAVAGEGCEVLAVSANSLGRAVKRELSRRYAERSESLLAALGQLRALDEDKLHLLAVASKSVLYRRGEVLCWEGDSRGPQSNLEVVMMGEARRLRASVDDVNTTSSKDVPKLTRARSTRSLATMQNAGSLLPGQAVNTTSLLTDSGEPFTVQVESAELVSLCLAWSDLVRLVPAILQEELKAWASQRLAWHRGQITKLFQEVKQVECSSPHSGTSRKLSERARLDDVLHDKPELVCRKAKQPPGHVGDDGRDLLTSILSIHRRPDPLTAECPTVHEALIPRLKGHPKPESPGSGCGAAEELSSPLLLTNAASLWDEQVLRTCEDWGLRQISAAATKLNKHVRPIEPMHIAQCLPSPRAAPLPALPMEVKEVLKIPFRGKAKACRRPSLRRAESRGAASTSLPSVPKEALRLGSAPAPPPASSERSPRLRPLGMLPLADKVYRPQKSAKPDGPHVRGLDSILDKGRRGASQRRLRPS